MWLAQSGLRGIHRGIKSAGTTVRPTGCSDTCVGSIQDRANVRYVEKLELGLIGRSWLRAVRQLSLRAELSKGGEARGQVLDNP